MATYSQSAKRADGAPVVLEYHVYDGDIEIISVFQNGREIFDFTDAEALRWTAEIEAEHCEPACEADAYYDYRYRG